MNFNDEKNYIINLKLMKITGLYQLINPQGSKCFGFNVYKVAAALEAMAGFLSVILLFFSSYFYLDNTNELMSHFMLLIAILFSSFKIVWVIRHSESIWNMLDITSTNFLSYKGHKKEILQTARGRSNSATILFVILWCSVMVAWSISPFFIKDIFVDIKFNNETRRFRSNALNYAYPVSEEFHNKYYLYFYIIEMHPSIICGHSTLAYATFVISLCIAIAFQLKTIAVSYSELCFTHDGVEGDVKDVEENDLEAMVKFKQIIQDQQRIFKKIKEIYTIFEPLTYLQLAAQTMLIILQAFMIFINHHNSNSWVSFPILKLFVTVTPNLIHLFITCYLFGSINDQQDSMNFALYSSNWTGMSTKYKKLMLLCMRMNDATKLKLRISSTKVVNLEMFASVMHLTYSIISVLAKSYGTTNTT